MKNKRTIGRYARMFRIPAVLLAILSLGGGCIYVHDHGGGYHHGGGGYRHHYYYDRDRC